MFTSLAEIEAYCMECNYNLVLLLRGTCTDRHPVYRKMICNKYFSTFQMHNEYIMLIGNGDKEGSL